MSEAAPLAQVVRDGFVESEHEGHVALVDHTGRVLAGLGNPHAWCYPRSAVKPLQAAATVAVLADAGRDLDADGIAIASASHQGSATQQVEAAQLLALAGLDETALRCPEARPTDEAALEEDPVPTRLAHNCSGKHAAFLYAHTVTGGDPAAYLDPATPLQCRIRGLLAEVAGLEPEGPGVDGCGAPAWRLPLASLAAVYARFAATDAGALACVRAAMTRHPGLVGGDGAADTELMQSHAGLAAKRGAEGILAAGLITQDGPRGIAVKIADGAGRAAGPVVAALLAGLGVRVPDRVRYGPVLGGGVAHGRIAALESVASLPR